MDGYVTVDGVKTPINGKTNLLEVIRASGVDLPTFCYHSELSVYGACRMCIAEIEGRGVQPTCSTPPEDGMVVRTNTEAAMKIRRMSLELMLANHHGNCQTCDKNTHCRLQELAERLGVKKVRFENDKDEVVSIDEGNPSIVRDPNKCILCGDCVRMCREVQGIGVLDFAGRGSTSRVTPAFGKNLNQVECVYCGQCASVCPTGALTIKSRTDDVWAAIHDENKTVVVQIAPAVRAAIAEQFGIAGGEQAMAKAVSALRRMGFDRIYDTSFTADLTTIEEATEFLDRLSEGKKLPQFTSCCPAWVKFAEQFYPDFTSNLSSCKSPQQMFGTLAKKHLSEELGKSREDIFVVSIMPCTAKKFEAQRPEFSVDGDPDVNVVLSSQELIRMIGQAGLKLGELPPESMDMPFGFKTGAGVIFGASGGVAEAVLRLAAAASGKKDHQSLEFHEVRGLQGIKEATIDVDGTELKLAVVSGLANTREILEKVKSGDAKYDIIEVMACRGGCVGGGGQPLPNDMEAREARRAMIYDCDAVQPLHNAADNPFVKELYSTLLKKPNSSVAHKLLHTDYKSRRRIRGKEVQLTETKAVEKVPVSVCVGTNCYLRGSYDTLKKLTELARAAGVADKFDFKATFCFEKCKQSPNVKVGDEIHGGVTPEKVEEFFAGVVKAAAEGEAGNKCRV